jgi:hypothetical protein
MASTRYMEKQWGAISLLKAPTVRDFFNMQVKIALFG